eukprot:TRINITY_DN1331_c0_g1_i1.p1 TRINITY_DN1331_c0_g1~~TRINITY_DN1331_c0_g1_i1.p1  ORF type:complete len:298 (-),score=124.28 TRINITY_DN1331_c0_g1_i1:104-997(-)
MIRRPPRSTQSRSSAASDVFKRQMMATEQEAATQKEANSDQPVGVENANGVDASIVCATPKARSSGDPFQAFLSILLAMLRGQVDITKYEDECRTLLGTYSYKLFTLDKLIPRFIKETNTLLQNEHWKSMKQGAEQVENGSIQPSELKTQMVGILWHNCFEMEYTVASSTLKISHVPMNETKDISALSVAAADILGAIDNEDDAKESGLDDDDDRDNRGPEQTPDETEQDIEMDEGDEGSPDDDDDDDAGPNAMMGLLDGNQEDLNEKEVEEPAGFRHSLLGAKGKASDEGSDGDSD